MCAHCYFRKYKFSISAHKVTYTYLQLIIYLTDLRYRKLYLISFQEITFAKHYNKHFIRFKQYIVAFILLHMSLSCNRIKMLLMESFNSFEICLHML